MTRSMRWTPARVGCYWDSGEYHISTFIHVGAVALVGLRSGYRVTCSRELIAEVSTFGQAKRAAANHARKVSENACN